MVFCPPLEAAHNFPGIWIQQQFVGVEAVPGVGFIASVCTQSIHQAGPSLGKKGVKYSVVGAMQYMALEFLLARSIKQTKFHRLRMLGKDGKIDAAITRV